MVPQYFSLVICREAIVERVKCKLNNWGGLPKSARHTAARFSV